MAKAGSFMVNVYKNPEGVAQAAAEIFIEECEKAIITSERFTVVLSGGRTSTRTYELLGQEPFRSRVDWFHVHIFWGDERCVPRTDARSNYGAAMRILLSHVPIPFSQIHPILCTQGPQKSALDYETILKKHFGHAKPCFDLLFLGLGKDGHTASLFPNSPALHESIHWVIPVQNASEDFARITLTPYLLNQTQLALFLITGKEKAEIIKNVLNKKKIQPLLPAKLIHPQNGIVRWLVDESTQD